MFKSNIKLYIKLNIKILFILILLVYSFFLNPFSYANDTFEVQLPNDFKNTQNLKIALKKLKSYIVAYSTNYAGNENQLKTFINDILACIADQNINPLEAAGLSESLAETLFKLKVIEEGHKRIFDQFIVVLDEINIKRNVSNKIINDAQNVYNILENKEGKNSPQSLIYKYYGVSGKGHNPHKSSANIKAPKLDGNNNISEIIKKYTDESVAPKKKVIGIEFMDKTISNNKSQSNSNTSNDNDSKR